MLAFDKDTKEFVKVTTEKDDGSKYIYVDEVPENLIEGILQLKNESKKVLNQ